MMEQLQKQEYNIRKIEIALAGLMLRGTVSNFLNAVTKLFLGRTIGLVETAVNAIGILMFFYGVLELVRKDGGFLILSLVFFMFLWTGSGVFFPENVRYIGENARQFFIYVLPFCWIGHYTVRSGMYIDFFLELCRVKLIIALITQVVVVIFPWTNVYYGDYMNAANAMLVGTIGTYYLAAVQRRKLDIILSAAATLVILVCGSRGVFVSLCFFWGLYLLMSDIKNKRLIIAALLVSGVVVSFFLTPILMAVQQIALSLGVSAHLLTSLVDNNIFEDSNRMELFRFFGSAIIERPSGYGIMGDRYISYENVFYYKPIYPHNIILEIMVDFGLAAGGIAIIWFTVSCVRCLREDPEIKKTVMVLLCSCIVRLMVSDSFWNDQMFFMLTGVLCTVSVRNILRERPYGNEQSYT